MNQHIKQKAVQSLEEKAVSGIYNDNEKVINYILPLEAGTYTITTGHHEWWGGQNRTLTISAKVDDGAWNTLGTTGVLEVNKETAVSGNVTLKRNGIVTLQVKDTSANGAKGAILSWLAVSEVTGGAPFGKSLEETQGAISNLGAAVVEDPDRGNVLRVTAGWNDRTAGHAEINDAKALFGRSEFTLLANVKIEDTESNEKNKEKKAAFSIGAVGENLHIFTQNGKLGYGGTLPGEDGGISTNNIELNHVIADDWNAMALVYEEKEGANGSATIYLNGQLAGQVDDIGFKLSAMDKLTATIGRSFSTNFLLNGRYDDIVVDSSAMTEAEAVAETRERLWGPLKKELASAVAKAKEFMAEGGASEELQQAVTDAEGLLTNDSATREELSGAIDKIKSLIPNYAATITINGRDIDDQWSYLQGLGVF